MKAFFAKFHFLQFQNWPKINFRTEKSLKLPKMQFHEKIFYLISMENIKKNCEINLFDFTTFFCLDFVKLSGLL